MSKCPTCGNQVSIEVMEFDSEIGKGLLVLHPFVVEDVVRRYNEAQTKIAELKQRLEKPIHKSDTKYGAG